jgi:hypothetical protein
VRLRDESGTPAYMPRYREPLEGLFLLLAGAAVWSWIDR